MPVTIDHNAPQPSIRLGVGFADFAKFRFLFLDANGTELWRQEGDNSTSTPDVSIGVPIAQMDGGTLEWIIVLAAFDSNADQYSVSVMIHQGGFDALGGTIPYNGTFTLAHRIPNDTEIASLGVTVI